MQLPRGIGRLAAFEQREQGVLNLGEVRQQLAERLLRISERKAVNVVVELVDDLGGGATFGDDECEASSALSCHGERAPSCIVRR